MASMNPFSRSAPAPTSIGETPGTTDSIASNTTGTVKAMGVSAKNAFGKTTSAVAGVFRREVPEGDQIDATDPLRLDNKPKQVDPEVFVANGQLWESTGDVTKAMESYTKALESDAKHAPALTSIARLHFKQGNLPQAAQSFQAAIEQSPQDAGLFNDLGLTLSKMGNKAGASATLERALQLAPGTSRYANNLASVRYESGDEVGALQVLSQNNKPAVAHFNMAYLHFKSGKMDQAKNHLGEAMKFEPQAASDAAVQRAVERSRDMLAQINVNGSAIAQATSTTPSYTANPSPVQQTAQAGQPGPGVKAATSMAPAMSVITPPSSGVPFGGTTARSMTTPAINSKATEVVAANPAWNQPWNAETTKPSTAPNQGNPGQGNPNQSAPRPTRPTEAAPSANPSDAQGPSIPFQLPSGFETP